MQPPTLRCQSAAERLKGGHLASVLSHIIIRIHAVHSLRLWVAGEVSLYMYSKHQITSHEGLKRSIMSWYFNTARNQITLFLSLIFCYFNIADCVQDSKMVPFFSVFSSLHKLNYQLEYSSDWQLIYWNKYRDLLEHFIRNTSTPARSSSNLVGQSCNRTETAHELQFVSGCSHRTPEMGWKMSSQWLSLWFVGARLAGPCISGTAALLGFSCKIATITYAEKNETMTRLVWAARKAMAAIISLFNSGEQNGISECTRTSRQTGHNERVHTGFHFCQQRLGIWRYSGYGLTKTGQLRAGKRIKIEILKNCLREIKMVFFFSPQGGGWSI